MSQEIVIHIQDKSITRQLCPLIPGILDPVGGLDTQKNQPILGSRKLHTDTALWKVDPNGGKTTTTVEIPPLRPEYSFVQTSLELETGPRIIQDFIIGKEVTIRLTTDNGEMRPTTAHKPGQEQTKINQISGQSLIELANALKQAECPNPSATPTEVKAIGQKIIERQPTPEQALSLVSVALNTIFGFSQHTIAGLPQLAQMVRSAVSTKEPAGIQRGSVKARSMFSPHDLKQEDTFLSLAAGSKTVGMIGQTLTTKLDSYLNRGQLPTDLSMRMSVAGPNGNTESAQSLSFSFDPTSTINEPKFLIDGLPSSLRGRTLIADAITISLDLIVQTGSPIPLELLSKIFTK